jgi:hypothetical protein
LPAPAPAEPPPPVVPTIYPDDVFLVSYPKSGNTWLRFLAGNYVSNTQVDFVGLHVVMPDLHLDAALAAPALTRPRFIKSHSAFDASFPRVVYLVRDGRDVAVSSYFHQIKFKLIQEQTTFSQFILGFIENGFHANDGPWSDHVESWIGTPRDSVLLVKYEDTLADPAATLRAILAFADLPVEEARVARAVERSSFAQMRSLEEAQHDDYFRRYKGDTTEIRFVREGRAGSWKQFFTDDDLERFMARHGATMRKVGYR